MTCTYPEVNNTDMNEDMAQDELSLCGGGKERCPSKWSNCGMVAKPSAIGPTTNKVLANLLLPYAYVPNKDGEDLRRTTLMGH